MTEEKLIQLISEHLSQRLDDLRETSEKGFEKINDRLDLQNGRLRKAEDAVITIKTAGKTVSIIYGTILGLLSLFGGCAWQGHQNISAGQNSAVKTELPTLSSGEATVRSR